MPGTVIGETEFPAPASVLLDVTDFELLQRIRQGDEPAFAELVERYGKEVYGVASALLSNSADAEDVLQETFAAVFAQAGRFRGEASVKTWLLRIALVQIARVRRWRWRHRTIPLFGRKQEDWADVALVQEWAAARSDLEMDVMTMLARLREDHRQVIVLRELEGLTYDEMATVLGVPRGTVESRLHRARQELKQLLRDYV